jgi:hypothetical protein
MNSPLLIIVLASGLGVILVGIGFFLIPNNTRSRLDQFVDSSSFAVMDTSQQRTDQLSSFRQRLNSGLSLL